MSELLHISHLTKRYPSFVLDDVSLSVPEGCIVGLVGENGAGKTTTIKAALGLIASDAGEISLFGRPLSEARADDRAGIGAVLGCCPFPPHLSARLIAPILAGLYAQFDRELFFALLERFGIAPKKPIRELSGGMLMKLALAAELAHAPRLLILDEATNGLDPVVRREALDLFSDFIEDGAHSVLLSTHITDDLARVADYLIFLHGGRVVLSGEKDALLERYCVVKGSEEALRALPGGCLTRLCIDKYGSAGLCPDRSRLPEPADGLLCDRATIDDILMFFSKGVSL